MKVVLYMATSVNGMIAKNNDNTDWISKEEWDSYSSTVQKAGNLIVGHRTYDILTQQPEFSELEKIKLVVVSSKSFRTLSANHIVAHSPKEALELLKNFDQVIVAGGGILNTAFLTEKLVDDIYIDIEPIILGRGIKLFADGDIETELELVETKKISPNEIQLHYKVKKD
ncbi:dihydrofolate reductase [Candidatus Microgenomates bacterium]|nr:dihydrofolate reductase [Candidatus Microgenomates bacterium]